MNFYTISDKIVFNILRDINFGYLELIDFNNQHHNFGNPKSPLKANIRIKNQNFTLNLIKGGKNG